MRFRYAGQSDAGGDGQTVDGTDTLAGRVSEALKLAQQAGYPIATIAKKCGVSRQAVYQWRDGNTQSIEGGNLAILASLSGLEPLWISRKIGPKHRNDAALKPVFRVPVISYVRAGAWNEAVDPHLPGAADDYVFTPKDVGANAFALRVEGDSMVSTTNPSFPEGCIVIIDPRKKDPIDRQYIVARLLGTDQVTFKQFRKDEFGRIWLQPLNPLHQPIRDEFAVLGTVVQKLEDVS